MRAPRMLIMACARARRRLPAAPGARLVPQEGRPAQVQRQQRAPAAQAPAAGQLQHARLVDAPPEAARLADIDLRTGGPLTALLPWRALGRVNRWSAIAPDTVHLLHGKAYSDAQLHSEEQAHLHALAVQRVPDTADARLWCLGRSEAP